MSLPVTLGESALQDLQNIQQYCVNQGSTKIAEQLLEKIFAKLELLADYPEMGRVVPEYFARINSFSLSHYLSLRIPTYWSCCAVRNRLR